MEALGLSVVSGSGVDEVGFAEKDLR
jgi:hypothetical protein